jgi:hypothetical protein
VEDHFISSFDSFIEMHDLSDSDHTCIKLSYKELKPFYESHFLNRISDRLLYERALPYYIVG